VARRSKTSNAEALIDLVALLPWWAGVALAFLSYVILHSISQPVATTIAPGQVGAMVSHNLFKSLAAFGQVVLPIVCLAGAGVSAWRRRERQNLVVDVAQSKAADALDGMSWQEFEMLVGEAFRLQGYAVTEIGGGGADGGVDLALTKGGEKFLVQCKQWRAYKVGVDVVRELFGVMVARGATGGFVVTSGRFTDDATAFASGRNVRLVDGPKLRGLIQQASSARAHAASTAQMAPREPRSAPQPEAPAIPACPLCFRPMVKRVAKRGANAKSQFWGCTTYPKCRGTRSVG
jgi:restriction system protein